MPAILPAFFLSFYSINMEHQEYHIRQLQTADADLYKTLRLEALTNEPGVFSAALAVEQAFSEAQWIARLSRPDSAIFGLFYDEQAIGITGVLIEEDAAHCTQSYICTAHRGRHLSRLFYETRIAWAKSRGLKRIITAHRLSNLQSMRANQHFGFKPTHSLSQQWPDGSTEELVYYALDLS